LVSAAIFSFSRRTRTKRDWSDQELAEFHRVADALTQAGRRVETDRGVTDEGDPWFVFIRPETDEVIAHFARIDGEVVADASALAEPVRGANLRETLDQVAQHYTLVLPNARRQNNLFVHPAAILAALVATALLEVEEASAQRSSRDDAGGRSAGATGDDARTAAGGQGQQVAVANPAGRAVSFNESGLVGESQLNTGVLFSTIAAVLSLSAHTTNAQVAATSQTTVAIDTVADFDPADTPTPNDETPSQDAMTVSFGDFWLDRAGEGGAPAPVTPEPRGDGTPDQASAIAAPLPQAATLPLGPRESTVEPPETAADEKTNFSVRAHSPVNSDGARTPAAQPDKTEAEKTDGESEQSGAASEASAAAEAVESVLESGAWQIVSARDAEKGASADDGSQPADAADDWQQAVESAADELQAALANADQPAPSPSDFVIAGPESGHASLVALADFFDKGAFNTVDLTVVSVGDDRAPGSSYGVFADDPPLLVAYDSDVMLLNTFSFMPGVVFVDEELLSTYADVPDDAAFEVALDNDASVAILGFYSIDEVVV
jgi:hypothetical protein